MSIREKLCKRGDGVISLPTTPVMVWSSDKHLLIATNYNIYQVVRSKGFGEYLEAMEVDTDSIEIFSNETKENKCLVEEKAKLSKFDSEALEMSIGSDKLFIVSKDEGFLRLSWVCLKTWRFRHGEKFSVFVEGEGCWITQVNSQHLKKNFVDLCGRNFPPCDVVIIGLDSKVVCFSFVKDKVLPYITAESANVKSKLDFQRTCLNIQIEKHDVHMTTFSSLLSLLRTENVDRFKQKFLADDITNVDFCGNIFFLLTKSGYLWKYSNNSLKDDGFDKSLIMKNVKNFTAVNGRVTMLTFTNDIYSADFLKTDFLKTNLLEKHLHLRQTHASEILKNIYEASKNIQSINNDRKEQKTILNQLKLVSLLMQTGVDILQSSLAVQRDSIHPKLSVELENTSETVILGKFWSLQVTFATRSQGWLAAETYKLPVSFPVRSKLAFLCQIPKVASKDFPLRLHGSLLFNTSILLDISIVQSMPLFKHQIGIFQCLDVAKVINSTERTHDEIPVIQLSQKDTNRQTFRTFLLNGRKYPTPRTFEEVSTTAKIVLIELGRLKMKEIPIVRKLQDCEELETKRVIICHYDGGVLKFEIIGEEKIKVTSKDHELLKAVQQELEVLMKHHS